MNEVQRLFQKRGLAIICFPCNQFQNQEPFTNKQIQKKVKQRYGSEFVTMDKCDVHGPKAHPVFRYLRANTRELVDPQDRTKLL